VYHPGLAASLRRCVLPAQRFTARSAVQGLRPSHPRGSTSASQRFTADTTRH
jgi:hypothetical protein